PLGVIPSALLFGALRAGASRMQFRSQIPVDIIQVIQGLVLVFVAGERIVRWLYRLPSPKDAVEVQPSSPEGPRSS
ncbi:MAG: putative transporter permease protein, partial [Bacteroidetes bacterium]|nr:putative transporter permease protein [Bacteroidota bacterium]